MSSLKNSFMFFPSVIRDWKSSIIDISEASNLSQKSSSIFFCTMESFFTRVLYSILLSVMSCWNRDIAFRSQPPELFAI